MNHRIIKGKYGYLVRWKGWQPSDDSWGKSVDMLSQIDEDQRVVHALGKKKAIKQKHVIIQDDTDVSGREICEKSSSIFPLIMDKSGHGLSQ